jgi:hypothetical protein
MARLEIFINERGPYLGELSIDIERIDITSGRDSYKPDPAWNTVCKAGHFHAFTRDGKLPTLQAYEKQMPCNGMCSPSCGGEGWSETRYRCRACGKRVKPGYVIDVPGGQTRTIPGLTTWRVTVRTMTQWNADVSVRAVMPKKELFGIATPRMVQGGSDGFTWDLIGISELGERAQ